jgi:hypothetical protein
VSQILSVEPAADFGLGHGSLIVTPSGDAVVIERADHTVYIPSDWMNRVAGGEIAWARLVSRNPWLIGSTLEISGTDRTLTYKITGSCGPRVQAAVCQQLNPSDQADD